MISLLFELIVVVGVSVLAHMGVAYLLAPRKAKQAILDALVNDDDFQLNLVDTLMRNLMSKRISQDGKEYLAIDPIILRAKQAFQEYIETQQKEIERSAGEYAENAIANQENPMLAMVLSQVPKKYRWLLPFVAQFMQK